MPKLKTSITLSEHARRLVDELSKRLGISKSSVIELAIRRMAEAEGVKAEAGK